MDDNNQNRAEVAYAAIEELEGATRSVGWDVEYRQISKGSFSTGHIAAVDGAEISMTSVDFKDQLQIVCSAPQDRVGFFLPRLASGEATMCGTTLSDGCLVLFSAGQEMELVVSDGVGNETILVPEAKYHAIARALAPSETLPFPEATTIYQADPLRFAPMRREISSMLRMGCLDAEAVSNLLAMLVHWITEASPGSRAEHLHNGIAVATARQARDFIEENYRDKIRLEDLCTYTGVGSRTLQRCFASYFQVGLFEYIKVCRLHKVRRALMAADSSVCSVTQIAIENGFSHLGRFSLEYRAFFGEYPRKTLATRKANQP